MTVVAKRVHELGGVLEEERVAGGSCGLYLGGQFSDSGKARAQYDGAAAVGGIFADPFAVKAGENRASQGSGGWG